MSERNRELVDWDEPKEKEQAESSWTSGAEQMRSEERELQRDKISKARPDGSTSSLTDERVMPEGMGGAGGGDVDDVGDVGFPEEASGRSGDEQAGSGAATGGGRVIAEGMGGAGGGDIDDVGDVGYPDGAGAGSLSDTQTRIDAGIREGGTNILAGGEGGDIEIQRKNG